MKKISYIVLLLLLVLTGCTSTTATFKITYAKETIEIGEIISLTTNIEKINGKEEYTNADIVWESSDEVIATVTDGVVEAKNTGEVTITATVDDLVATKNFNVINYLEASIKISGVQTLDIGKTTKLTATVLNSSSSVSWSSENPQIATVNNEGTVSAVGSGLVLIHASLAEDASVSASYPVYVKQSGNGETINVNEILKIIYEMQGELDFSDFDDTLVSLVSQTKEAVVGVSNYAYVSNRDKTLNRVSVGTGTIFSQVANGDEFTYTLLTNYHVVEDAIVVKIYLGEEDREVEATVLKTDEDLDLALVEFTDAVDITPLVLASEESYHTGDFVYAIGNANGYEYYGSVTFGVISCSNRNLDGEDANFIQHDAAINPGNSGGPLFNMQGEVIGINTLKLASSDIDNMGFSVSIKTVNTFLGE